MHGPRPTRTLRISSAALQYSRTGKAGWRSLAYRKVIPQLLRLLQAYTIYKLRVLLPELLVHKHPVRRLRIRFPARDAEQIIWAV
jgi:hypothetical protein